MFSKQLENFLPYQFKLMFWCAKEPSHFKFYQQMAIVADIKESVCAEMINTEVFHAFVVVC